MQSNRLYQLPAGIKDYLFEEAHRRRLIEKGIIDVLRRFGYREVITPTFEYLDVFLTAGRNSFVDKIYRFLDRDGNLVALRSDFTAQVARIVASKQAALRFPVRLWYSGKVFRFEELHAGRSRESWQVGFELIGEPGDSADAETVKVVVRVLQELGAEEYQINLGTIEYFNGIVEYAGLQGGLLEEVKYLIDHKDVDTLAYVLRGSQLPDSTRQALENLILLHGDHDALQEAVSLATNPRSVQAISNLTSVYDVLSQEGLADRIVIDLSDVEGMEYYSGLMIKAYVRGVGFEVGSGGRYDQLLSRFGKAAPAVGFSFNVDHLVDGLLTPGREDEKSVAASRQGGA